jgi:DNA-3-methyladenine glycosylase II
MAGLVAVHGPCLLRRPARRRSGPTAAAPFFAALAESVLYQQLAGAAAATIHRRFVEAVGGQVTPEAVAAAGFDALRGAGLSGSKARTISNLARAVTEGELDLDGLARAPDDEIVAELVRLPGIGPWTAQMFCIFTLGRLDVWPTTDYGVRKGYAAAYDLDELPSPRQLQEEGERFRPYRSVAAWYLWRAAETVTPAGGGGVPAGSSGRGP